MASSQPFVRQVNRISMVPQFIVLVLLILIFYWIGVDTPFLLGAALYLLLSLALKSLIPKHHRKGIQFTKRNQYDKALAEFQKSYEYFMRHRWIDRYRAVVLLSSSRISYLEMAMLNMAFCSGQLGDGAKSRELYERTLEQFPDSKMAETSLKMFDAAKNA